MSQISLFFDTSDNSFLYQHQRMKMDSVRARPNTNACSWELPRGRKREAHAGNGGAAKDSTDSQNRVGSWSCEGRMPDTSWEATECRGVSRSKNLKKQSKGGSHPKLVHDSETATECVSLEQKRRLIEKQLCTIHPNPGPRRGIHGGRNMEQKMERRKRRRDRRKKRAKRRKLSN